MDEQRGVIKNKQFALQVNDFSGLVYGKISPTDLDCFIDFGNRLFVFVEAKHCNSALPYGQRLALERLCDATHAPPVRSSIAFCVSHNTTEDVNFAATEVTLYRWNGEWRKPQKTGLLLRDAIDVIKSKIIPNVIILKRS